MKKVMLLFVLSFFVLEPTASGLWLKKQAPEPPPVKEPQEYMEIEKKQQEYMEIEKKQMDLARITEQEFRKVTKDYTIPYPLSVPSLAYNEKIDGFKQKVELLKAYKRFDERFRLFLIFSDEGVRSGPYFKTAVIKKAIEKLREFNLLRYCSDLELTLGGIGALDEIVAQTPSLVNLVSLSVGGVSEATKNVKFPSLSGMAISVIKNMRNLRRLEFKTIRLMLERGGFESLGNVTNLTLHDIESPVGLNVLLGSLTKSSLLNFLHLRNIGVFQNEHLKLVARIPNLKSLRLEGLKVDNQGVKFLATCKSLENIEFYNLSGIGPGIGKTLLKGLESEFINLEGLTVSHCPNVPLGELGVQKYLKKLHIFRYKEKRDSTFLKTITDMLKQEMVFLRQLYLGGFELPFSMVLDVANKRKDLEVLSIPGCYDITVQGVKKLVSMLPKLKKLYVFNDIITKEDIEKLNIDFKNDEELKKQGRGVTVERQYIIYT